MSKPAARIEHPDMEALALIGANVRARVEADDSIFRFPTEAAEIFAVANFFTPAECTRLRGLVDATAEPSRLFESTYESGFRTSYSGNLSRADPFIRMIERRIDDLLGLPSENAETVQGQRYMPGQEFKAHQDYFHTSQPYWDDVRRRGGQRSWTAMAFLNQVEEGGATDFPKLDLSIPPQTGALLFWNNMNPDGSPNPNTLHAGRPVVRGTKYIITKWYRARKWA
ncbi:MAG: 2OG-Fe(II) oxygenase [Novosphingobium sp.]|nr:2OG-Fe(II) oxygenase [Novosphingobium sp.]